MEAMRQETAARPFTPDGLDQLAGAIELVEAREDQPGNPLLVVALRHQIASEYLQPALPLPDVLPQVRGAVAPGGVGRVALATVMAPIERQKGGRRSLQPSGHAYLVVADGEVHQRPVGEAQQRFRLSLTLGLRVAIKAVLIDGILHRLGEVGLDFDGGDRDAIQEQHQIDAVLVVLGRAHLPHHAQPVALVVGEDVRVQAMGRLEPGQQQLAAHAQQVDAVAQHRQRPLVVQALAQPVQQRGLGLRAVLFDQRRPRLGLPVLDPGDDIGGEQGPRPVIARRVALGIEPAVSAQVFADFGFKGGFVVERHGKGLDRWFPFSQD